MDLASDFGDLDDQMVWVPIGDIHPWDKNPRDNDAGVEQVAASIKTFGFVNPIIVQLSSNRIIAGHTRFKASHHLSLKRVRVIFADFDDDKANAYAIADNKLAELSSWDDDILPGLLADLKDKDFDLSTLGFGEEELSKLLCLDEDEDFTEEDLGFKFQILIEDLTETTQCELFERLEKEGWVCRPLTI